MSPSLRFLLFAALVLGLPAALMASGDPDTVNLGKLALILGPAVFGSILKRGLAEPGAPALREVGRAVLVTVAVAVVAVGAAALVGVARFTPSGASLSSVATAAGGSALTSVLEELGWAVGGLALARAALGRVAGVVALGLLWAGWHLVPVALRVGLFPQLEAAPPAMIGAFVVACLLYRALLTELRDAAGTWWAAAVGHAAPNVLLAGAMAAGLGGFDAPADWVWFPAPGGLVFPLATAAALRFVRVRARGSAK